MDSAAQASGEKRVRQRLVEPLLHRGLARPSSLTVKAFEDMLADMCARLAYMSDESLAALEEVASANPGGKDKDRFPIANFVLEWAREIEAPPDDASPLIRAVFAHALGTRAIREGWAPELLGYVRKHRKFPKAFVVSEIQREAGDTVRRLIRVDEALARGGDVPQSELDWADRRRAQIAKCQQIAQLGRVSGDAA